MGLLMKKFDFIGAINRLKKIMDVTQDQEVAARLGLDKKNFARYKRDGNLPLKEIFSYCMEHNIIINSILTGNSVHSLKIVDFLSLKEIKDNQIAIPYYSNVQASCGGGAFCNDDASKEFIILDKNEHSLLNKNVEAVNSFGDSMIPLIKEDSIVFIDRTKTDIIDSGIYLFYYEEQLYLKVLARELNNPDHLKAVSLNQMYPVIQIDNLESFRVIGKFIYST